MTNLKNRKLVGMVLATSVGLAAGGATGAGAAQKTVTTIAGVPFVSYGTGYQTKLDFAQLDDKYPIPAEALKKLMPQDLKKLDQEQLDQLYARLSSGPIPDGKFDGTVYLPKGNPVNELGGYFDPTKLPLELKGVYGKALTMALEGDAFKGFAEALWHGKHFYKSQSVLRNRMTADGLRSLSALGVSPALLSTIKSPEIELFPAKLYCGTSLADVRRESIIIDYYASSTIEGYRKIPDVIASGDGLAIRDEIRMVRPGFYLGKAYAQRAFLLTFALYNPEVAEKQLPIVAQIQDECWSGNQERKSSLAKASE